MRELAVIGETRHAVGRSGTLCAKYCRYYCWVLPKDGCEHDLASDFHGAQGQRQP